MSTTTTLFVLAGACAGLTVVLALVALLAVFLLRRGPAPDDPVSVAWRDAADQLGLRWTARPLVSLHKMKGAIDGHTVVIIAANLKKTRYSAMEETTRYVVDVGGRPSEALQAAVDARFSDGRTYTRYGSSAVEVNCPWLETRQEVLVRTAGDLMEIVRRHG